MVLNKPGIIISGYVYGTLIIVFGGIALVGFIGYQAFSAALVISEFFIIGYSFLQLKSHAELKI